MTQEQPKKMDRRNFLGYTIAAVAGLVVGAAATYTMFPQHVTTTSTVTTATTVTSATTSTITSTASAPSSTSTSTTIASPTIVSATATGGTTINILAQDTNVWDIEDKLLDQCYSETGVRAVIAFYSEDDRRAKELLDASTHAGAFQVYYVDEANIATMAANKWIYPIQDYYPSDGNFSDFFSSYTNTLSYNGTPYGAPMYGEADMNFYRTDLIGPNTSISLPVTLDDFLNAATKLQNPPSIYGCGTRGARGSGANVWRWSPYLVRFGGTYLDASNNPVFNSPEAVAATAYYIKLIKLAPSPTMLWSDVLSDYEAGKEAIMEDANGFYDYVDNQSESVAYNKFAVSIPCKNSDTGINVSATSCHGLGISTYGCPTDALRKAAGAFIGWWTNTTNELNRVNGGAGISIARTSTLNSSAMAGKYPANYLQTVSACIPIQKLCIPQIAAWPEIGDYLGINLEELFTAAYSGTTVTDAMIKASLDDAVAYAKNVLSST
ncbi:MAG: extracellular solute-binding protein [Nitrososphaeria archaeon]